jgi:hypothetical protein
MADLSYSDVQRAVQDGLRNMQVDVQRLSGQMVTVSQQSDAIQQMVQQLYAQLARLERQSRGHNPRTELGTAQLARDVQELKIRFVIVERFCQDMSKYVQAQIDKELEDKQYRAA